MRPGFRQAMAVLHSYAGIATGWVLFFMFVTGTLGFFDEEIDRWMRPETPPAMDLAETGPALDLGAEVLARVYPDADRWYIEPPTGRKPVLTVWVPPEPGDPDADRRIVPRTVDPVTGELVNARATGGARLLYRMHYNLHYMPLGLAYWIVGFCTMAMGVAIISGIIVHRRIFRDFFTYRPGVGQRSWLTLHNLLSVSALPFHVMITYSGLVIMMAVYQPFALDLGYGPGGREAFSTESHEEEERPRRTGAGAPMAPVSSLLPAVEERWGRREVFFVDIVNPGDSSGRIVFARLRHGVMAHDTPRLVFDAPSGAFVASVADRPGVPEAVYNAFYNLHEGLFAGPGLRWLYFLSGLAGAVMIATGLFLWTVKRRERAERNGIGGGFGLALVERANAGVVAGLPIGVAGYFWANRLIPVGVDDRAAMEAHVMFAVWALAGFHALVRPAHLSWRELSCAAAAGLGGLPLINALTTDRHLGYSVATGDWGLAGIDLVFAASGVAFAFVAWRFRSGSTVGLTGRLRRGT